MISKWYHDLQAIEESSRLQQELNTLKEDNSSLVRANAELSKKLHDKDVGFAKERSELQANHVSRIKHSGRVQAIKYHQKSLICLEGNLMTPCPHL